MIWKTYRVAVGGGGEPAPGPPSSIYIGCAHCRICEIESNVEGSRVTIRGIAFQVEQYLSGCLSTRAGHPQNRARL